MGSHSGCCSVFRIERIIEYASFKDLLLYPFEEVKAHLHEVDLPKLRTSENRKQLFIRLLPFVSQANSWDELFELYIDHVDKNWKNE